MLLCVTSQQIIAQRLRVRQQAIPLVAQVHGWESRTRRESGPTDPGLPDSLVAKAIPARHLTGAMDARASDPTGAIAAQITPIWPSRMSR
ncbi:hypothetical protein GCM10009743_01650 [Kribbella swartbergensis]